METNGYYHNGTANGFNGASNRNGLGAPPRIMTVDEALPYSPFSSVVPFNSGMSEASLLNSMLTHLQQISYLCQRLGFVPQLRYLQHLKSAQKGDEVSKLSTARRKTHITLRKDYRNL